MLTTSWDDGTPEDVELGRLLARHGFRGTFYATTGPGGSRTVSDDGLAELVSLGHELGNHGRTHRSFVEMSAGEVLAETSWGADEIQRFGPASRVVAPPRGRTNRRITRTLNSAGLVVRTAPIIGGREGAEGTLIPTAQLYPHGVGRTTLHLLRRHSLPAAGFLWALARSGSVRGRLSALLDVAARRSTLLHLWGHSREIDRLGLWPEVERFLGEAADRGFAPLTNGEAAGLRGEGPA